MRETFSVYEKKFWQRKAKLLATVYPRLAKILSDAAFSELMIAYLKKHPCESHNLVELGRRLPQFLRQRNPWHNMPHLAELARFEWAFFITTPTQIQLVTSFYAIHAKTENILMARQRKPYFYALFVENKIQRAHKLTSHEYRILYWIENGAHFEALLLKSRRLHIRENDFFKIFKALIKKGLIAKNLFAHEMQ